MNFPWLTTSRGPSIAGTSSAPAFDAEVYRGPTAYSGPSATDVHTLSAGISVGKRALFWVVDNGLLSSVVDSKGNTYSLDVSGGGWAFYSSPITTALASGDTITVTYTSAFTGWRLVAILFSAINITAFDTYTIGSLVYASSCSVSVTPSAAALVIGGVESNYNTQSAELTVDGTAIGNWYGMSSNNWIGPRYKQVSSSTATTLGGTYTGLQNLQPIALSYK